MAIVCRFCGLEYVKALAESGAVFEKSEEQPHYWLAVLELYKGQREVYCDDKDDCFDIKIERTCSDNLVKTFHLLPLEQRMEIVKYLCENSGRVNFAPGELLYYSIMSNNQIITTMMRKMGVIFSEKRIHRLTEHPGAVEMNIFVAMLRALDDDVIVDAIRNVVKEIGGKRIYCDYKIYAKNYDRFSLRGSMKIRLFKPEFFGTFLKSFKLNKWDRTDFLKEVIDQGRSENLAICAEQGWLNQPEKRNEMIAYATEIKSTECLAWLLDYKNRNFDLAAERERAEKKAQRELNAAPNSITALKDIWSWKKQEDGTIVITGYNGTGAVINVPPTTGKRAVTAIGEWTFPEYIKRVFPRHQEGPSFEISKVVLPDSIRSIGEMSFARCRKLEELVVPDGTVEIGKRFFWGLRCA